MEFQVWLILSSIEIIGVVFLFAQLMKKIETSRLRVIIGWSMFAGGIGIKIILYGIEMAYLVHLV